MNLRKIVTPKILLLLIAVIGLSWLAPEQLFSSPDTPRVHYHQNQLDGHLAQRQITSQPEEEQVDPIDKMLKEKLGDYDRPSLISQAAAISMLSLLPFIIMILTSFMKIVIVLSLLRNALGVQQAPPNQILNGVALMLTLFIMFPTASEMYKTALETSQKLETPESFISKGSSSYILAMVDATKEPLRNFLIKNSSVKHQALFYRIAYKVLPEDVRQGLNPQDFIIVVPAYVTSQLKDAFEIGVLIYIPFFVIDLVTSNILLAMGMMMLSPVTISMPLKLFLLVMLDGWTLLVEGLVNTFR